MIDTNKYLSRCYDQRFYNCFDFVREIWLELTHIDLECQTRDQCVDPQELNERALHVSTKLSRLSDIADPCLILFQRPRIAPHIGVFMDGKVLHLRERGPMYQPLYQVTPLYPEMSFYHNVA